MHFQKDFGSGNLGAKSLSRAEVEANYLVLGRTSYHKTADSRQ